MRYPLTQIFTLSFLILWAPLAIAQVQGGDESSDDPDGAPSTEELGSQPGEEEIPPDVPETLPDEPIQAGEEPPEHVEGQADELRVRPEAVEAPPQVEPVQINDRVARIAEHDRRAAELFAVEDFSGSLAEQQAAQELLPATPRLFNMAVCQERLGHRQEAIQLYRQFITAPDSPSERREAALHRIDELHAELAAARGGPEAGGNGEVSSALPREATHDGRVLSPVAFYTMLGLAGASVIATIVCGAITLQVHQEFLDQYRGEGNSRELQLDGQNMSMVTNILLGVTAVLGASALALGLVTRWHNNEGAERTLSIVPSVSAQGAALSLGGRF